MKRSKEPKDLKASLSSQLMPSTFKFIHVAYKDPPELSTFFRRKSSDMDLCTEKTLLVNPNCPVRVMLEFIRKKTRLAITTQFDLCDESGILKNLFSYPTFQYVTQQFEHKKVYYLIVIKLDTDKMLSVLPQLSRDNKLYAELQTRVKKYLHTGPGYSGQDSQHTSSGKLRTSKDVVEKHH